MKKRVQRFGIFVSFISIFILNGCLYPNEQRYGQQIPPETLVRDVQQGIDRYYEEKNILPIVTKPANTPIYEKYVIDFRSMVPRYLAASPPNIFEKGGNYFYVLLHVEQQPTVKLLDLRIASLVRDVQKQVDIFRNAKGSLPIQRVLTNGYYQIDFSLLNMEPKQVRSVYSGEFLPLVLNAQGTVGVDYRMEVMKRLESVEEQPREGEDLRYLLTEHSVYVPAKSFPCTLQDGELVLAKK